MSSQGHMQFEIDRLGAQSFPVDLSYLDDDSETASEELEPVIDVIVKEWVSRRARAKDGAAPMPISPTDWLKLICYDLVPICIRAELFPDPERSIELGFFRERAMVHKRGLRGAKGNLNPFQIALLGIFARDRSAMKEGLREQIGKELWYAHRHYVPKPFLLGFIKQVGSKRAIARANGDEIEPGFEGWIKKQRKAAKKADKKRL